MVEFSQGGPSAKTPRVLKSSIYYLGGCLPGDGCDYRFWCFSCPLIKKRSLGCGSLGGVELSLGFLASSIFDSIPYRRLSACLVPNACAGYLMKRWELARLSRSEKFYSREGFFNSLSFVTSIGLPGILVENIF